MSAVGGAGRWARARAALRRPRAPLAIGAAFALALAAIGAFRSALEAPEPTLLVLDPSGRFVCEVRDGPPGAERGFWPLTRLPPRLVEATLALEDRRFGWHPGVDPLAIARAAWGNLRAGRRVSGASTLAMQVARLQRPGPRTYPRKLVEAATAVALTLRHGRERALGHYLRLAPYGNGIRGIGYAARRYLGKPVEDLSWAEIAFLAAIPQSPSRMNPYRADGRDRAVCRGQRILGALAARGVIDGAELELARRQLRSLVVPRPEPRPLSALHAIARLERMLADPATRAALGDRPIVETTIDLALQSAIEATARAQVLAQEHQGVGNAAVAVIERTTGRVRAWVGSIGWNDPAHDGAIDYGSVARSPGSTVKPFLYALALERGVITPASVLEDAVRGPGGIVNSDERSLGPLLPRSALANSRNVPAVRLLQKVGLDEGFDFLREAGLHDGERPAEQTGLSLAIGGQPTTLERLVRACTALAGDGRVGDLVWWEGQARPTRRLVTQAVARQITSFLSDPLARLPTFPRMGATEYPFPVAVKTGTSSGWRDAWTVAWSHSFLVAAWMGHPRGRPMAERTGYRSAALLVRSVLLGLHPAEAQGLSDLAPRPPGFEEASVCARSGQLATPACERTFREWFRPGQRPVDSCEVHLRVAVDPATGVVRPASEGGGPAVARTVTLVRAGEQAVAGPRGPAADGPRLRIRSPENGLRLRIDPEAPPAASTLPLEAEVQGSSGPLVWWVDGRPWRPARPGEIARWPLVAGEHAIEARLATGEASPAVVIRVE